jgi:hypothetical protein
MAAGQLAYRDLSNQKPVYAGVKRRLIRVMNENSQSIDENQKSS